MRQRLAFAFMSLAMAGPACATETVLLVDTGGKVDQLFTVDARLYAATLDAGAPIADPATGCGVSGLCRPAPSSAFTTLLETTEARPVMAALAPAVPANLAPVEREEVRRLPGILTWVALAVGFVLAVGLLRGPRNEDDRFA